jgi:hypothetical protein
MQRHNADASNPSRPTLGACFTGWRFRRSTRSKVFHRRCTAAAARIAYNSFLVGSVTTLSNLLRMLYSRAGDYPPRQPLLYAESFSPNTPEGACPNCHGIGRVHDVAEQSLVPDDGLTVRERAIAA